MKELNCIEIAELLGLQKNGNNYHCFNPDGHKNGDQKPSLSIFSKGFRCFGCDVRGDAYDLVKQVRNVEFNEAKEWLAANGYDVATTRKNGYKSKSKRQIRFVPDYQGDKSRFWEVAGEQLRLPTDDDLAKISKTIKKKYSLDTFQLSGARIFDNGKELGIALWGSEMLTFNPNKRKSFLVVEGRTDYLSAISMNLHENYGIISRFNLTQKINIQQDGIYHFLLDNDGTDSEENLKKIIKYKNPNCFFSHFKLDQVKDLSDYYYYGGSPDEIDDYIIESKSFDVEKEKDVSDLVFRPNWDNKPERSHVTLRLNDVRIGSKGNLTIIVADQGVGKSAISEAIISSCINPNADNLGFTADVEGVVYLDTERSQEDVWDSWYRSMRRAAITKAKQLEEEFLIFDGIKKIKKFNDKFKYLMELVKTWTPGILILDSITGFTPTVNDEAVSIELFTDLLATAEDLGTSIVATIHLNAGSVNGKARGHVGSEAMRVAESILHVAKEPATKLRKIYIDPKNGKVRNDRDDVIWYYQWSDERSMMVSADAPAMTSKDDRRRDDLKRYAKLIFKSKSEYSYNDLKEEIIEIAGVKEPTAKKYIKEMDNFDIIINIHRTWRLNENEFDDEVPF